MPKVFRTDSNHADIRNELRALGWTVEDRAAVGDGVADFYLSIGPAPAFAPPAAFRGVLNAGGWGVDVEVKAPGGKLTKRQQERAWLGTRAPIIVAETTEDILAAVAELRAASKGR